MGDVAGVNHEGGLCPECTHLGDRFLERAEHIWIGRLVEADMAVRNLDEGKARRGGLRLADDLCCWNASRQRPHETGPAPQHAFERLPAIDPVNLFTVHLRLLLPAERRVMGETPEKTGLFPRNLRNLTFAANAESQAQFQRNSRGRYRQTWQTSPYGSGSSLARASPGIKRADDWSPSRPRLMGRILGEDSMSNFVRAVSLRIGGFLSCWVVFSFSQV